MPKSSTPWRDYQATHPGQVPDRITLSKWRRQRLALAKSVGAKFVCQLCGRPLHRFGYVWLRTPRAWRSTPKKRQICYSCYVTLDAMIDQLEATQAREHLPPEGAKSDAPQETFQLPTQYKPYTQYEPE